MECNECKNVPQLQPYTCTLFLQIFFYMYARHKWSHVNECRSVVISYLSIVGISDMFYVDKLTGIIYANASFDREEREAYDLVIKALNEPDWSYYRSSHLNELIAVADRSFNRDDASLALVHIRVVDLNDNQPRFPRPNHRVTIKYQIPIGEAITRVFAEDADAGLNSSLIYSLGYVNLYRRGFDKNEKPVRPIPSPFNITADGRVMTTQLMTQYPIGSRFVLPVEAREKAPPHRVAQCQVHIWIHDPSKLIRMTIKTEPENVHSKREDYEASLSNATGHIAILNEIKYHVELKTGKLMKQWSDVDVHFVDLTRELNPLRVIEKLDTNEMLHRERYIERISMASLDEAIDEADGGSDVLGLVFIGLLFLIVFGFVITIVCCCCLKSWYAMSIIEKSIKDEEKSKASRANSRIGTNGDDEIISLYENGRQKANSLKNGSAKPGSPLT